MFCFHCGKQLDEAVKFCNYCGTAIEQPVVPQADAAVTEPDAADPPVTAVQPDIAQAQEPAADLPVVPQTAPVPAGAQTPQPAANWGAQPPAQPVAYEAPPYGQPAAPQYGAQMSPYPPQYPAYGQQTVQSSRRSSRKLKENKPLLLSLIAIVAIVVLVGGLFTGLHISRVSRYNKAQELFDQGDFVAARDLYAGLEDFRDSADRLTLTNQNTNYLDARALLESAILAKSRREFEDVQILFRALGNFKDSAAQMAACDDYLAYFDAEDLLAAGSYYDAYQMFNASGVYDWEDRALACTQPYPENGIVYRNPDYSSRAVSVTFKNDISSPTYVKLYAENGDLVLTLFLDGNASTTVYFGSGSYKINRAIGSDGGYWFGETDTFGDAGDYITCLFDDSMDPYSQFSSSYIYTITFYTGEWGSGGGLSLPIGRGAF